MISSMIYYRSGKFPCLIGAPLCAGGGVLQDRAGLVNLFGKLEEHCIIIGYSVGTYCFI